MIDKVGNKMNTKSELYINKPLELSPDKIKNIDSKRVEITINHKFDDGSQAEFNGTYENGKQLWYSTVITDNEKIIHKSSSKVNDLLKDLY